MRIRFKTKYNIGDQVVVHDIPKDGLYCRGEIVGINIKVGVYGTTYLDSYIVHLNGWGDHYVQNEKDLESLKEFNNRQKQYQLSYDQYLDWVNKQYAEGEAK